MSTTPIDPAQPPESGGFLAPKPGSTPSDVCYRCGKPTPAGVAVCAACNPGKVKGPSATQLHATILGGIILGAVILLVGWRFAVGQGGPYAATVVDSTMYPDGGPAVTISVANTGERSGVANCRRHARRRPAPGGPDLPHRTHRARRHVHVHAHRPRAARHGPRVRPGADVRPLHLTRTHADDENDISDGRVRG